jgi:predicted N-formylglutamate amidohydrolase
MDQSWEMIDGGARSPFLLIADHASNHVPSSINLGITAELLNTHIAIDIGVAPLGRAICAELDCPGILGSVSRLVVDLNREEDADQVIPTKSDGHIIPGNTINGAERADRIKRYWQPYHSRLAAQILTQKTKMLISLHSFTSQLETRPEEARPWEMGILYNEDDRAARIAIPFLEGEGVIVGDQLPYSGKHLNATMNRHAEANGIAYLGIEMRQDLIASDEAIALWAPILSRAINLCQQSL